MTFTPAEMAIQYASYGWLVIPVMGKRPVGNEWQKRASCDQATVARLFAESPHDGVGVQLGQRSGLIDFDCDSEEAEQTIQRLFDGNIPKTPEYRSTRGKHRLFAWSGSLPQVSIKLVVDGLEIRTGCGDKGAQTVFPPSGGRVWDTWPDDCRLAEIPSEVIDRINARYAEIHKPKPITPRDYHPTSASTDDCLDVPRWLSSRGRQIIGRTDGADGTTRWHIECPGIERHTTGNSYRDCCVTQNPNGVLGGSCFHSSCGMSDWSTLRDTIGAPTYDDYHPDAVDYPAVDPIGDDQSSDTVITAIPTLPSITPVDPDAMNESFYRVPGLIGEMIKFHINHAPRPRPELSLVASISLLGAVTGRKIQTESGLRTNIYCVGLAPSGSGKERPRNQNVMCCIEAGIPQYLGSENPASDAALVGELAEQNSLLIQIDEVSRYFSTIRAAGNNSSHLKAIFTRFLELTGQAENPIWRPKGYADKAKSKTIAYPSLCIYGTSTADGFWGSVSSSDAVDGFLARMMVVEASRDYPRFRRTKKEKMPADVIEILKDWHKFTPNNTNDMSDSLIEAMIVPIDSAADERIYQHCEGIEDRLTHEADDQKAIWSRCSALAQRLSLLFAASRGPRGIQVTLADAESAVRLANWCTRLLIRRVFTHVSENEEDNRKKRVLEIIRRAGTIGANALTRKTQWIKGDQDRKIILRELLEAEFILKTVVPAKSNGTELITYTCI